MLRTGGAERAEATFEAGADAAGRRSAAVATSLQAPVADTPNSWACAATNASTLRAGCPVICSTVRVTLP
jgi:hypothetical protein